jgi:hypothetical protein
MTMTGHKTPQELIAAGREIIERDGWHQGYYYGSHYGTSTEDVMPYDAEVAAAEQAPVCSEGALRRALSGRADYVVVLSGDKDLYKQARRLLEAAAGVDHIPSWNDDPSRTVEDVLLAFKRAEVGESENTS